MMESECLSSCFICGKSFLLKQSPLMRRCDSFKDLRELVLRLCGLLSVEVTPEDWEGVDGDYLMKQTISCDKCFDVLKNVERVHELLLKTQRELKQYLDDVESLIIRSDTPNYQCSFWRSSCFKLRRTVLEKVFPAVNVGASLNSLEIEIKEEWHGGQSVQNLEGDQIVDNHFEDDDWNAPSPTPVPPSHNPLPDDEYIPNNEAREFIQTPIATVDILSADPQSNSSITTRRKARKRKIIVIAEEDEVPEGSSNFPNIFNPPTESRKSRGAKKIAEAALQVYASSGDASDNEGDEEYKQNMESPSPQLDSSEDNASDDSEDEEEETAIEKARRQKKRMPQGSAWRAKYWWPFLFAQENLYLYHWDTFIQNTFTHLKCLAYDCHFQTEWDYFSSFQIMRAHLEENHTDRRHRQRTPHPCVLCNILYNNRQELLSHLRVAHPQFFGKKSKAVCEGCTMTCSPHYCLSHVFTHKNLEEQAAAIAAGEAPLQALRKMEKQIEKMIEKAEAPKECEESEEPEKRRSTSSQKTGRKNNRMKVDNTQLWQFMCFPESENVYIYRFDSFVLNTRSHLECKAYKCGFKTEFDYYSSFQRMRKHMEENHRSRKHRQRTPHPCVLCSTIYKNREDFTKHFNKAHSEPHRKSVCESCLMTCNSSHTMTHMFSHKSEEEKADAIASKMLPARFLHSKEPLPLHKNRKYSCQFENCKYSTNDGPNFRRHQNRHLPKEQRTDYAICPDCGVHILKESLNSHILRLHRPEEIERSLVCKFCDKRYLSEHRIKFEAHLRTHTGERPFLCTQCGKAFYQITYLNAHVKNVHNTKTQEWPCQWCDMVYTKEATLRIHWGRKHPDKWQPKKSFWKMSKLYYKEKEEVKGEVYGPVQKFPCDHCEVICGFKHTLVRHLFRKHGIGELNKKAGQPPTFYRRKREVEEVGTGDDDESRSMSADEVPSGSTKKWNRDCDGKYSGSSSSFLQSESMGYKNNY